jgi:hypothetical protein
MVAKLVLAGEAMEKPVEVGMAAREPTAIVVGLHSRRIAILTPSRRARHWFSLIINLYFCFRMVFTS